MTARLHLALPIGLLLLLALLNPAQPARAQGRLRTHSVSLHYTADATYAGRLQNAEAAFRRLEIFLANDPFAQPKQYSFLNHVLQRSMVRGQGFVQTQYGFGYGACGAPSLLNQLAQTAYFIDSDGIERPVFEVLVWRPENSPTYGKYGAAIFLDLQGARSSDYVWQINPAYAGLPIRVSLSSEIGSSTEATFTLLLEYSDEF
jgi:hypothetical protein